MLPTDINIQKPLRITGTFICDEPLLFRDKLLCWMARFKESVFFNSNHVEGQNIIQNRYDWLAGIGAENVVTAEHDFFVRLHHAMENKKDWWFGYLGYDLKNETEKLVSEHTDFLSFPQGFFFNPRVVVSCHQSTVTISITPQAHEELGSPENIFARVNNSLSYELQLPPSLVFKPRIGKKKYLSAASKLMYHIQRGDIYEINFCQEFYSEGVDIDPLSVFLLLRQKVPAPFSCFFRIDNRYMMSASPERYLRKDGERLYSQPMKGTAPRGLTSKEDELIKAALKASEKEISENVMIVDLVRNDLSRVAMKGSVQVDELFGLYSFPKVHQMVSTVSCKVIPGLPFTSLIKNTFPMGSMTGAPKIRAMQLIEQYEESKRGVFSGSAGYIEPSGDFDFNVMIRSFLYNSENKYLSIMAGSAITAAADPEKEFDECLLKAGYAIEAIGGRVLSEDADN